MAVTLAQALTAIGLAFFARQHRNAVPLETPSEVKARVTIISESAVKACAEVSLYGDFPLDACATLLQNLTQWESALWLPIHAGTVLGPSGERGLPQIHRTATLIPDKRFAISREEWLAIGGTSREATEHAFRMQARIVGWHALRCHRKYHPYSAFWTVTFIISEYHQPSQDCKVVLSKVASKRAGNWERMLKEVREATR